MKAFLITCNATKERLPIAKNILSESFKENLIQVIYSFDANRLDIINLSTTDSSIWKERITDIQSILLDKNFEPENPKSLEELTDQTCKWPIGHPNEEKFYFCGRKPEGEFPYCKLHVLYAFQPKGTKEEVLDKEDDIPEFIEKKVKASG